VPGASIIETRSYRVLSVRYIICRLAYSQIETISGPPLRTTEALMESYVTTLTLVPLTFRLNRRNSHTRQYHSLLGKPAGIVALPPPACALGKVLLS